MGMWWELRNLCLMGGCLESAALQSGRIHMICARVVTCISSCAACQFNSCSAAGAKARASYVGASATCSVSSVMLHGYEQVAAGGLPSARTCTQLTMHDLPSWPDAMHWGLSFWRCTVGPEFFGYLAPIEPHVVVRTSIHAAVLGYGL